MRRPWPWPAPPRRAAQLAVLKAPWAGWVGELRTLFDDARKAKAFDARKLNSANCARWLDALQAWADDPLAVAPELSETAGPASPGRSGRDLGGWARRPRTRPLPPSPICPRPGRAARRPRRVLHHGARWVAERFAEEQARRAQMGFDDLLTRLDAALRGPNGARLAERSAASFRWR
jgi:exodeoxyribonuclease V beta subunit